MTDKPAELAVERYESWAQCITNSSWVDVGDSDQLIVLADAAIAELKADALAGWTALEEQKALDATLIKNLNARLAAAETAHEKAEQELVETKALLSSAVIRLDKTEADRKFIVDYTTSERERIALKNLAAAEERVRELDRMLRGLVDALYGTAYHHIGDGDGVTAEEAESISAYLTAEPEGKE